MTDVRTLCLRYGGNIDRLGSTIACLSIVFATAVTLSAFFAWTSFLGEPNSVIAVGAVILPGIATMGAGFHLADRIVSNHHEEHRRILRQILDESVAAKNVAYGGCDWRVSGQEPDGLKLTLARPGAPDLMIHVSRIAEERGLLR